MSFRCTTTLIVGNKRKFWISSLWLTGELASVSGYHVYYVQPPDAADFRLGTVSVKMDIEIKCALKELIISYIISKRPQGLSDQILPKLEDSFHFSCLFHSLGKKKNQKVKRNNPRMDSWVLTSLHGFQNP